MTATKPNGKSVVNGVSPLEQRGMPVNLPAERMLLGGVLKGEIQPKALESALAVEDFGLQVHQHIVTAMYELHRRGEGISGPTIYREICLTHGGVSLSEIISLTDDVPLVIDIEGFIRAVKNKAIQRKLIYACEHTMNRVLLGDDTPEAIGFAQKVLSELSEASEPEVEFITPYGVIEEAGGMDKYAKRRSVPGIPMGWGAIDRVTHGMHPGELIIVAGSTSKGKSAFSLNVAFHAARGGAGVAVYSMEMKRNALTDRLICISGEVDSECIRRPQVGDAERVMRAVAGIKDLPVYLCDRSVITLPSIEGSLRRIIAKHPGIKLGIIDYIGLITPTGRQENRTQEIGKISRGIKVLAGELGIPIIVVCQLTRKPGAEDRRPELEDLRDSGNQEQDADVVLFVHSTKKYDHGEAPEWIDIEVILAKQREGRARLVLDFQFKPSWGVFSEKEKNEEYANYDDQGGHQKRSRKSGKATGSKSSVPNNPPPSSSPKEHREGHSGSGREAGTAMVGLVNGEMGW